MERDSPALHMKLLAPWLKHPRFVDQGDQLIYKQQYQGGQQH